MKQFLLILSFLNLLSVFGFSGNYFGFVPTLKTTLKKYETDYINLKCFKSVTVSFNSTHVNFDAKNKKTYFCYDTVLISNHHRYLFKNIFLPGETSIDLHEIKEEENKDLNYYGLNIFYFKDGIFGSLLDIYKTSKLFVGSHLDMEYENLNFIKEKMNYKYEIWNKSFYFEESQIKSGDYFSVTRLDGLDPMIMWGTGSFSGHTAIALRIDGDLYICESTDENPFGESYWPKPYGIIKTPYKKWLNLAEKAGYMVSILRLNKSNQLIFEKNLDEVIKNFVSLEGLSYGKNNFLFGWIDQDENNFPGNLSMPFITNLAANLYKYSFAQKEIDTFLTQALNHRLDTIDKNKNSNYNFIKIISESIRLNYSLYKIFNIPEDDNWDYSDGKSYVCNTLVTLIYKLGGLFNLINNQIQATEFSPRDSYMVKIFDNEKWYPSQCDNGNGLCQIMGKYKVILPEFNTIEMYPKMNQKCPSLPPKYDRPDKC
tara:strand:+ start:314 stop:1765 length:1452 start_codon:yes stop_codon:yes gene_type:complete